MPERAHGNNPPTRRVGFWQAFRFWLKLGCISFGGPAGQIAIMHQELVERRRWISERRFLHALNYCMLLPGPEAQQLSIYLGWLLHRAWGGISAGLLFILPSFLLLLLLSWVYLGFGELSWIAGLFYGIKPAVTAVVLQAVRRIGSRVLINPWLWSIAGCAFMGIFFLKLPFPLIIGLAAAAGFLGGRLNPGKFTPRPAHPPAAAKTNAEPGYANGDAFIDDIARLPHTQFRWSRLIGIVLSGLALWLVPMLGLAWRFGWSHPLTQMATFFSKAALLTFGGAYAVLPYVYQGAVETYHWLTPQQMLDGLALGETTPGPLIMVVSFVGFVAGWTQNALGPEHATQAAVAAACVVTYFSFLPGFLFILAGGPLVESSLGNLNVTAPLTGVTAAVVGVILNLALFFAWHVFWPQGFEHGCDGLALGIGCAALYALMFCNIGVIPVIISCGLSGVLLSLR